VSEVIATLALKASDGFSQTFYSVICVVGYIAAFYFLSLVLKSVPVGIAYAIWAGMGLILAGVAVINLYSKTVAH